MKKLIALIAAVLLTACNYDMNVAHWNLAESICKDRGGAVAASYSVVGYVTALCRDGVEVRGKAFQ